MASCCNASYAFVFTQQWQIFSPFLIELFSTLSTINLCRPSPANDSETYKSRAMPSDKDLKTCAYTRFTCIGKRKNNSNILKGMEIGTWYPASIKTYWTKLTNAALPCNEHFLPTEKNQILQFHFFFYREPKKITVWNNMSVFRVILQCNQRHISGLESRFFDACYAVHWNDCKELPKYKSRLINSRFGKYSRLDSTFCAIWSFLHHQ